MGGKHSRNKGHGFERYVCNVLKGLFPNAKRHLESQIEEASWGYDIDGAGIFKIQCKAYKNYAPITAINQVEVREGEIQLLVTKGDRLDPMVALSLASFIEILSSVPRETFEAKFVKKV